MTENLPSVLEYLKNARQQIACIADCCNRATDGLRTNNLEYAIEQLVRIVRYSHNAWLDVDLAHLVQSYELAQAQKKKGIPNVA